jgi:hypothetical protein
LPLLHRLCASRIYGEVHPAGKGSDQRPPVERYLLRKYAFGARLVADHPSPLNLHAVTVRSFTLPIMKGSSNVRSLLIGLTVTILSLGSADGMSTLPRYSNFARYLRNARVKRACRPQKWLAWSASAA